MRNRTRVVDTPKEPFGPCAFEQDPDVKVEEDLCKVRSGNRARNALCQGCPSPHRARVLYGSAVGIQAVRPVVPPPPTDSGAAPMGNPRTRKGGRRGGSLTTGKAFLELYDRVVSAKEYTHSANKIAKYLLVPYDRVLKIMGVSELAPAMRQIILDQNLSIDAIVVIQKYPERLHATLAKAWSVRSLSVLDLSMALYYHKKEQRPLRTSLAEQGLTEWPEDLDENGMPISI